MMLMSVTMHPIWQTGAIILAVVVAVALVMQVIVHRLLSLDLRQGHTAIGGTIFSVIGTTYAVLLAFMATTAWDQYHAAEDLARREADLAGTVFYASYGAPEPASAEIRAGISAYLDKVVNVEWPAQIAGQDVASVEPLLQDLNSKIVNILPSNSRESNIQAFLITAISELATARHDRRLATNGTIPQLVWVVLVCGGALMVGFSFMLGAPTLALHMLMTAGLVTSGVLVLLLIVGLSSPFRGAVTISPQAYTQMLADIRTTP